MVRLLVLFYEEQDHMDLNLSEKSLQRKTFTWKNKDIILTSPTASRIARVN